MVIGILFACLAFIMVIFIVVRTLIFGDAGGRFGPPWACLILLIGGVQLICIGILGTYLSKTYLEVKKRPIYVAKGDKPAKRG